jgi:hypothetical protein
MQTNSLVSEQTYELRGITPSYVDYLHCLVLLYEPTIFEQEQP